MRMRLPALLVAYLCMATVQAQETWLVDSSGDGDFTSIAAAIRAAEPGDEVLVLNSSTEWSEDLVIDKPLSLVALETSLWVTSLTIIGIPAGQSVSVSGLSTSYGDGMRIENCAGRVFVERMDIDTRGNLDRGSTALYINNCAFVTIKGSQFEGHPGAFIIDSSVVFSGSYFRGESAHCWGCGYWWQSSLGISARNSDIHSSATVIVGGTGEAHCSSSSAVSLSGGSMRFCGGGLYSGGSSGTPLPLVEGDGQVYFASHEEDCSLIPSANCDELLLPCIISTTAVRNYPIEVDLSAPAESLLFVLLARPGTNTLTPWGSLWIDLGWTQTLFAGQVPLDGVVSLRTQTVPASLTLGEQFMLQAGVLDAAGLGLSPPVPLIIH